MKFFLFAYWHEPAWKQFVGATVKIWELATNLNEDNHQVILFLPKYNFMKFKPDFKIVEIPIIDCPILRLLSFNFFLFLHLLFNYRNYGKGIVYVRRMSSVVPLIFAKFTKKVFFYEVNDDPYHLQQNYIGKYKLFIKMAFSSKIDEINIIFADAVFIISQKVSEKIIKRIPKLNKKKLNILASGTNISLFHPQDQIKCRLELGLPLTEKLIGFAGSLLKHQGIDTLIDAAQIIVKNELGYRFVIIGEGPMRDEWSKRVVHNRLSKYFVFTRQITYGKVPLWINAMDICVAPFLKNAGLRSPVKIFEYMACGKAVVASEINGTTDIFMNSQAIEIVPPENPIKLAKAIISILNNPVKMHEMGSAGRSFVVRFHDRKESAKRIAGIAQEVI